MMHPEIHRIFQLQKDNYLRVGALPVRERLRKIKRLEKELMSRRQEIKDALYKDHKKTEFEADMIDMLPVLKEIRYVKKNLYRWCADAHVPTPLLLLGSSSRIKYESKGVVLIVSPWNFPVNLSFVPLVSAIAAGNCVMIKPSEHVPHISKVIEDIVKACFDENEIAVIQGGVEEAKELLTLPFHHIFFTGSPKIGKIVMKQAAEHLTSVTLELGGKSPAIVDKSANLVETAKRLLLVKYLVNGQICIAPDYVLVHKDIAKPFGEVLQKVTAQFLGANPEKSENYSRIVNDIQHRRMKELVADARENGEEVLFGGDLNDEDNYLAPTVVITKGEDSRLMNEEVFGPILPLKTYEQEEEIIDFVRRHKRPLAMYIFSKNKKVVNKVIENTRSGAVVVNAAGIHHYNSELPFGGVNNSGIGKSHGKWGFMEFSNPRAIVKTNFIFNNINLLMPPTSKLKKMIVDIAVKYL